MARIALVLASFFAMNCNAWAWGDEGHKIVCEIAMRLAVPSTRARWPLTNCNRRGARGIHIVSVSRKVPEPRLGDSFKHPEMALGRGLAWSRVNRLSGARPGPVPSGRGRH